VTLLFIVFPLADIFTNVWPLDAGNVQWRYGFFGITSNYLVGPLFGMCLLAAIAVAAEHRRTILAAAALSALGGVLLLAGLAVFGLDILQLRNNVRPEAEFAFRTGSVKSFLKILATGIAMAVIAAGSFRAARTLRLPASRP